MIEPDNKMPISIQCNLLNISRSTAYYQSKPYLERCDKGLVHQIIEMYREYPFYGYRKIKLELERRGYQAGRSKIQRIKKELKLTNFLP